MGITTNITADTFPAQGNLAGKRVAVCYGLDASREFEGVVLRDDVEAPMRTIILLDNGRTLLDTECQFRPL